MSKSVRSPHGEPVAFHSRFLATPSWRVLGATGALAIVLTQIAACGDRADAQGGPPQAPPVSVAPAVQKSVIDSEEFSGRLEASEYVELRPRVGGTIDKDHFVEGASGQLRKGDAGKADPTLTMLQTGEGSL